MKRPLHSIFLGFILLIASIGMAAAEDRWQTLPQPPPMPAPAKSGYAPVNGIEMYYAVYGSGDPGSSSTAGLAMPIFGLTKLPILPRTTR